MIGEENNELEEMQTLENNYKLKGESDSASKKTKKLKIKTCNNCKEYKLKNQELEQLNTKLMQINKNLKQSNKDTQQKLNEALKEIEKLTKENEKLQKLLQELDDGDNIKNINDKIVIDNNSKEESSENEEEKENGDEKIKEEEKEIGEGGEEINSQSVSKSDNKIISKIINPKNEKMNSKFTKTSLLTNEVITDILDRLAELEKFRIFMEASAQTTDSKISFLESKIIDNSRRSSDDIGVPTTIKLKGNKLIPAFISKSMHKSNVYNKPVNDDDFTLSNDYNNRNEKYNFNRKFFSENYIKSSNPRTRLNSFRFNSKILNDNEDLDLIALGLVLGDLKKLKNLKVGYKLLYRASIHGDSVKEFHKRCDNIYGTLTVIKTKEGMKFGGYCSICWESGDEQIKEDLNSFVFSINLSKIYFVSKNNESSIFCDKNKGPGFIGMFIINDNMLKNKSDINPWGTQRYSGESSLYEINGGEPNFDIEELEVFQVLFR